VDAADDLPLRGAIVAAWVAGSGFQKPVATDETDVGGHFLLSGLRAASYWVTASKRGYLDTAYGQRSPTDGRQAIGLQAGDRLPGIALRMSRPAVISGVARDEAGDPLVGFTVQALRRTFASGVTRFEVAHAAETNDRGEYRLIELSPGGYVVAALSGSLTEPEHPLVRKDGSPLPELGSPSSVSSACPTWFFPSTYLPSLAEIVTVGPGEERTAINLQDPGGRRFSVSGHVEDEGSGPGLAVSLVPVDLDGSAGPRPSAMAYTVAPDGAFTFSNVPAGQYHVRIVTFAGRKGAIQVTPRGTPRIRLTHDLGIQLSDGSGDGAWAEVPVSVVDESLVGLQVHLNEGRRIRGTLEFHRRSHAMPPALDQLGVTVRSTDGREITAIPVMKVGNDGAFSTPALPPGRYSLAVTGLSTAWSPLAARVGRESRPDGDFVVGSDDLSDVVVSFTDTPAVVKGLIATSDGVPAADVPVYLFPQDRAAWTTAAVMSGRVARVWTDVRGTYQFSAVAPGDYLAVADRRAVEFWTDPAYLDSLVARGVKFRIDEGEQRTENLRLPVR